MTLYDQYGRPIDLKALKEEQAAPSLTGVRTIMSGHPSAGLTPRRLGRLLRDAEDGDARRYLELSEDMEEKDLHYRGVIATRKLQVSQLDVTVVPGSDAPEHIKHAEMIEDWINRESREEEFFDIADAIGKGYSVQEIIWDMSEKQWEPKRLEHRDPRWFEYDRTDGVTLMLRVESGRLEPLAPCKFVVHAHKSKSGLPIRGGLARAAAWCYLFKNFDIAGWVTFAEVFGQPLRVGKYGSSASAEDRKTLLRAVANIGRDASAIIPESMMVEFVKSEVTGSTDLFERLANYMDMQISKLVLGQTTTTDAISGGHAVSREHNEVREDIERADAKQIAAAVNRDVVRPCVDLNFGPQKAYPRIRIGRSEERDVKQVVSAVRDLVPMGLKVAQAEIRTLIGLSEPEADEELFTMPGPASQADSGTDAAESDDAGDSPPARAMARAEDDGGGDPVAAWIDGLTASDDLEDGMRDLFAPLEELADRSQGYDEFIEGLASVAEHMDAAVVTEFLARSLFSARLTGEAGLEDGHIPDASKEA